MANRTLDILTEKTVTVATDILPIQTGTDELNKISITNLFKNIPVNVGIGVDAAAPLHVKGMVLVEDGFFQVNKADGFPKIRFQETVALGGIEIQFRETEDKLAINGANLRSFSVTRTAPTDSLSVNNNGYVGLGVGSAPHRLTVTATNTTAMSIRSSAKDFLQAGNIVGQGGFMRLYAEDGLATTVFLAGEGPSWFNGGNVGIGNPTPEVLLTVGEGGVTQGVQSLWQSSTAAGVAVKQLIFKHKIAGGVSESHTAGLGIYNDGNSNGNKLEFYVGAWNNAADLGTAKMSLTGASFLGVGTPTPVHVIHAVSAGSPRIRLEGDAGSYADLTVNVAGSEPFSGANGLTSNGPVTIGSVQPGNGYINFWTRDVGTVYHERMRIANNGNVGIGTTTPSALLHIKGAQPTITLEDTVSGGDLWSFIFEDASGSLRFNSSIGSDVLTLLNNGNVGIGTVTPAKLLHLVTASVAVDGDSVRVTNTNASNQAFIEMAAHGAIGGNFHEGTAIRANAPVTIQSTMVGTSVATSGFIKWMTSSFTDGLERERGRISSEGLFGIGMTAPAGKLHIFQFPEDSLTVPPLIVQNLPTTAPTISGAIWNNGGVLNVVA